MAAPGGPAATGVTTSFALNTTTPTQLANYNNGRRYLIITNNDQVVTVYVAFGTNNGATTNSIPIPPFRYFEIAIDGGIISGDVSAIAGAGTPSTTGGPFVSYTEA